MSLRHYSVANSPFDCVKLVKQIVLLTACVKICVKCHCSEKTPTFCLQLAQKALKSLSEQEKYMGFSKFSL